MTNQPTNQPTNILTPSSTDVENCNAGDQLTQRQTWNSERLERIKRLERLERLKWLEVHKDTSEHVHMFTCSQVHKCTISQYVSKNLGQ